MLRSAQTWHAGLPIHSTACWVFTWASAAAPRLTAGTMRSSSATPPGSHSARPPALGSRPPRRQRCRVSRLQYASSCRGSPARVSADTFRTKVCTGVHTPTADTADVTLWGSATQQNHAGRQRPARSGTEGGLARGTTTHWAALPRRPAARGGQRAARRAGERVLLHDGHAGHVEHLPLAAQAVGPQAPGARLGRLAAGVGQDARVRVRLRPGAG